MASLSDRISKLQAARDARREALASFSPAALLWRWVQLLAHAARVDPNNPPNAEDLRALRAAELAQVATARAAAADASTHSDLA